MTALTSHRDQPATSAAPSEHDAFDGLMARPTVTVNGKAFIRKAFCSDI
jgi:hypothetical protein